MATDSSVSLNNVLIVGGGPAGLAAALMLAKRGWKNITVLEKRATADYYEPDKSFNYLIDGRGQKFTDFLGITEKLAEISVANTEVYVTRLKPDGSRKTTKLPTVNSQRKTAYWIPRRSFVRFLYAEIQANWQDYITIVFNTVCVQINRINTDDTKAEKLEAIARKEDGSILKFAPILLVGCDGINSLVRHSLQEWEKDKPDRFEMKHLPSPSSGLRYQVLSLPPNFLLDPSTKEQAVCTMHYGVSSVYKESQKAISLGILPLKNPEEFRTANIIRKPNHQIWKLKDSKELYNFLEQAFPQIPIREIVSPEEAERFVKSEGGYFPDPQYCSGLHFLLGQQANQDINSQVSTVGIALLGDAIHSFPPDIGQGVNSALEDVCILHEALAECDDDISQALPLYELKRFPDVKALTRLAQISFPWQYNQDPWGRKLWSINFFLRLILSRLLPYIFSPPAFFMIQNHQLSYQEILIKAQRTTRSLYVFLILILGCLTLVFTNSLP